MTEEWRPRTDGETLRARAALLSKIRAFFARREVLEVETPLLARSTMSDPHMDSLGVQIGTEEWFLQNSPEFAMKRLLAAGSGPIYQIVRAFRAGERGAYHNVEFTMLEWYRPGFTLSELMAEVGDLLTACIGKRERSESAYAALFHRHVGLDPHRASAAELVARASVERDLETVRFTGEDPELERGQALDLLFSHLVQPRLTGVHFVYDFPSCQAALAATREDGSGRMVARRFECYIDGLELANGYDELLDPAEFVRRAEVDNRQRALLGKRVVPLDPDLLAAMQSGLPECAGVALGVDRLLMVVTGASSIGEVISFPQSSR